MANKTDNDIVAEMAKRHSFSPESVQVMLAALQSSGGGLAQFNHPDLGGMGQWSGGMTMIGDMFNDRLEAKVSALAVDLSEHVRSLPPAAQQTEVSHRATTVSHNWWPSNLGVPGSAGSQNGMRYAIFPKQRRLVIEDAGNVTAYDTADHLISGAGQQQSGSSTLTFSSQHGLVRVADLRRVDI